MGIPAFKTALDSFISFLLNSKLLLVSATDNAQCFKKPQQFYEDL